MKVGVADYLLGVALEHQVLLALVQPALFQCPEVKNSVLPLEQLAEDACTHAEESKQTHAHTHAPVSVKNLHQVF